MTIRSDKNYSVIELISNITDSLPIRKRRFQTEHIFKQFMIATHAKPVTVMEFRNKVQFFLYLFVGDVCCAAYSTAHTVLFDRAQRISVVEAIVAHGYSPSTMQ